MPKNYENARQLATDCHRFKVGDKLPPYKKKRSLKRLFYNFLSFHSPAILFSCTEAVLLGYVVKFYCCITHCCIFFFLFVNQKRGSTILLQCSDAAHNKVLELKIQVNLIFIIQILVYVNLFL